MPRQTPTDSPCLQLILANPYISHTQNRPPVPRAMGQTPTCSCFLPSGSIRQQGIPTQGRGAHQGQAGLETGVDQGSISFPHPMTKDPHAG